MWIDTHAHIYSDRYENTDNVIDDAKANGIEKILMPNIDLSSIDGMHHLSQQYPDYCFPMMGLHPCSINNNYKEDLDRIYQYFKNQDYSYCAVGEIGTDLHWSDEYFTQQKEAFIIQMNWSLELNLPVVIHCRDSMNETIELLDSFSNSTFKGVFHCFSGNYKQAMYLIEKGFHLGVGGTLTYKKTPLREFIHQLPKDKIILETDSPYLPPSPYRGKVNQPGYLKYIGEELANFWEMSTSEVGDITTKNAQILFNLVTPSLFQF